MSKKKLSKTVIWIQYIFFRFGCGIIRLLPLKAAYALVKTLSYLIFFVDVKHTRRAITHVLHSGIRTDYKEAKKLAYASLLHMLKVFVEIVKFDQFVTEDNIHEYISVADDPISQKVLKKDTACQIILATAHLGNWELAGGTLSVFSGYPVTSIMRPLANYKIGNYFYSKRSSFKHDTYSKEKGLRPMLDAFKKGHTLAVVADQHASRSEGIEVTFFGHPARAHATPALLHLRTKLPITMPYILRKDDNFHFEYHCEDCFVYEPTGNKEEDIRNIVQQYTNVIERAIRKYPEQWIWSHRRWLDCGRGEYKANDNTVTEGKEK
ncbi:MAG: lysophospholipid acyltransferase family protein [Lentisphaeria bacterium]|nr:lysophospholipid acyltransferase family protein [Lentisphaeria bacterium]